MSKNNDNRWSCNEDLILKGVNQKAEQKVATEKVTIQRQEDKEVWKILAYKDYPHI